MPFPEDPNAPTPHGSPAGYGVRLATRDADLRPNGSILIRFEQNARAWTPAQARAIERGIAVAECFANGIRPGGD